MMSGSTRPHHSARWRLASATSQPHAALGVRPSGTGTCAFDRDSRMPGRFSGWGQALLCDENYQPGQACRAVSNRLRS